MMMGMRMGGGGARWTPASELGANGLWLVGDEGVTLAAQPVYPGAGWAGASWAGSGLGPYTHTAGAATALGNAILTVGLRYQTVFTVSGRTAGTVTYYAGTTAGTARSTNATFTEDLTCATNTTHSFVPSADFDGVVTIVSVTAISATVWTPKAATGSLAGSTLAQATPANMPWEVNSGIKFAVGTGDGLYLSSATGANCIHNGLGGTLALHYNMLNTVGIQVFAGTVQGNAKGFSLYESSGNLVLRIGNGVGYVYNNTAVGVVSTGKNIIILRTSNTDGISLRLNEVERLSGAMVGATTDNSIYPLGLGNVPDGSAYAPDAILQDVVLVDYAISDIQCEELEEYWS